MKLNELDLTRLRNEEHYQFHTDVKNLILNSDPLTLKIVDAFDVYVSNYNNESEALDLIRKSAITDDIAKADSDRDAIFRGMCDAAKAGAKHFNAATRQSALRIKVVLDHYGNLTIKNYDQETASITSLLADLNQKYEDDADAAGLTGWIAELKTKNDFFAALKKQRYTEESEKTMLRMKQVRTDVDTTYHAIVNRINALIIIEGESAYASFANEMNARFDSYSHLLAQRKGRNAKDGVVPEAPVA